MGRNSRLEKLVVELTAETKNLRAGLQTATGGLKKFEADAKKGTSAIQKQLDKLSWAKVGAGATAAGAAFLAASKHAITAADSVAKAAKAAGMNGESFQQLAHAANLAGVSQSQYEKAVNQLNVILGQARDGNKTYQDLLRKVGITASDTETALYQAADAFAGMEDSSERAGFAAELFGQRAGPRMAELLKEGRGAIEDSKATLEAMFSNEQLAKAEQLNDRMTILSQTMGVTLKSALVDVAFWMQAILEKFNMIEAQSLSGIQDRITTVGARLRELEGATPSWLRSQEGIDSERSELKTELAALKQREDAILTRQAQGALSGPKVGPDGVPVIVPPRPESSAEAERRRLEEERAAKEHKRALDRKAAAEKAANEREYQEFLRQKGRLEQADQEALDNQYEEFLKQKEQIEKADQEAIEARTAAMEDFRDSTVSILMEMGRDGESALNRLKENFIQTLLEMALSSSMGGGEGGGIAGIVGGLISGTLGMSGKLPGFAHGGSFRMPGAGHADSQIVQVRASPGEQVTFGNGGGGGAVVNNVVELHTEPGMTVDQERRPSRGGEQRLRIMVRSTVQEEFSRRGPLASTTAGIAGGKIPPKKGIS